MGAKPILGIPIYDGYKEAKEDLQQLLTSLKLGGYFEHFRVLGLLDSTHRIFEEEHRRQFSEVEFLNHKSNPLNFTANANRALRIAREQGVGALTVNMDCVMPSVNKILSMCKSNSMVSAYTMDLPDKPLEEVIRLLDESSLQNGSKSVKEIPSMKVPGYCFWLAPEVLQKVGVLDDASFRSSFEDDDITIRCLLAGFEVMLAPAYVYHKGSHMKENHMSRSGAYGVADNSLALSMEKFYTKWSIPTAVKHEDALRWILANFQWSEEMVVE